MTDAYQTDDEQVENLKRWWKENGTSTLFSIAIAMGAVFGWQSWQKYQVAQVENASAMFQSLLQNVQAPQLSDEQKSSANHMAEQLKEKFASSDYAKYAAHYQAQIAVNDGDLDKAEAQLRWVLSSNPEQNLKSLTNYRLAKVLLAKKEYDQALGLIDTQATGFEIINYELQGDILKEQGEIEKAVAAYEQAKLLNAKSAKPINNFMLDLKIQHLTSQLGKN